MMRVMTVQIAIRLPDDMVAFLDKSVAAGNAPSRAALVARAVEREMRRQAAEQDAAILRSAARPTISTNWSTGPSHTRPLRTDPCARSAWCAWTRHAQQSF